jgi:hypothetical protein
VKSSMHNCSCIGKVKVALCIIYSFVNGNKTFCVGIVKIKVVCDTTFGTNDERFIHY